MATALACALAACGGTDDPAAPEEVVATAHVATATASLAVREEVRIDVEFRDARGRPLIGVTDVTWESGDSGTVAVDPNGVVRGVKLGGPVTVTVTHRHVSASLSVVVVPKYTYPDPTVVIVVGSSVTLPVITVDHFGATIGTAMPVWTSADPAVARVEPDGAITGVATGTTTLSATHAGQALNVVADVGVPSPYDGRWTGTWFPGPSSNVLHSVPATVIVLFGEVRSFSMPFRITNCDAPFASNERTPIAGTTFAMNLPYSSTVTGNFASTSSLLLSFSAIDITIEAFVCRAPPLAIPFGVEATTATLSKQGA